MFKRNGMGLAVPIYTGLLMEVWQVHNRLTKAVRQEERKVQSILSNSVVMHIYDHNLAS
jgi:hypothetical protein